MYFVKNEMLNMPITRESIGINVWLVPTGNNIRHNGTSNFEQVREAKITKMARIKGEFTFVGSLFVTSFTVINPNDCPVNEIKTSWNEGYVVYPTLSDVEDAQRANKIRRFLSNNINTMSDNDVLKIGKLLDWQ
jgi:hypothetical protein